jgi:hypothetical protein
MLNNHPDAVAKLAGATRLIWQMRVFFTGALAPIYNPVLAPISRLLPLTLGIESLRAIYLNGADFASLWQSGLLLTVQSSVF